jgi:hypothetical protein
MVNRLCKATRTLPPLTQPHAEGKCKSWSRTAVEELLGHSIAEA